MRRRLELMYRRARHKFRGSRKTLFLGVEGVTETLYGPISGASLPNSGIQYSFEIVNLYWKGKWTGDILLKPFADIHKWSRLADIFRLRDNLKCFTPFCILRVGAQNFSLVAVGCSSFLMFFESLGITYKLQQYTENIVSVFCKCIVRIPNSAFTSDRLHWSIAQRREKSDFAAENWTFAFTIIKTLSLIGKCFWPRIKGEVF